MRDFVASISVALLMSTFVDIGQSLTCKSGGFGCVANPDETLVANYRETSSGAEVEFEITAKFPQQNAPDSKYVAIGFNTINNMVGSSVVQCVLMSSGNQGVSLSSISTYAGPIVHSYPDGLSGNPTVTHNNQVLTCSFTRKKIRPNGAPSEFKDISINQADCIVMAMGEATSLTTLNVHSTKFPMGCDVDYSQAKAVNQNPGNTGVKEQKCLSDDFGCVAFSNGLSVNYREINNNQDVEFFVKGSPPANGYVAIGFNVDDEMAGASIVECIRYNGQTGLYTSYAPSATRPTKPSYDAGIRNTNATSSGTELTCHFVRSKSLPNGAPTNFRDISQANCIIMSMGAATGQSEIIRHSHTGQAGCGVDYSKKGFLFVESESVEPLVGAHGCLMIIGWFSFISPGILGPRFMKKAWRGKCCQKDAWFRTHQIMQSTGLLCIVIGFILIWVEEEGEFVDDTAAVAHAIMGILAVALGVAQPIMAFFRCHPGTENRVYFNWGHFLVGNTAHFLSMACIMLAANLDDVAGAYHNPGRWRGVVAAYICLFCLTVLIMEMIKRKADSDNKIETNGSTGGMQVSEGREDSSDSTRKYTMACYYIYDGLKVVCVILLCRFMF